MRFVIWGEVGAEGPDGPVALSGRLRLLLAGLLMSRNAEISRNDLIAIVWGEDSEPANAEASLRQYISRLRKALADAQEGAGSMIATTPSGYRLDVERSCVDADVLADAVTGGLRPDDLEVMTSGEPYGSYCDEWWCLPEVSHLRDLAQEAGKLRTGSSIILPTGTVTFLFTDVEDSTVLWEQRPSEMELALRRHETILRSAIESHDGFVFSRAGDAFSAVFGRVDDAVAAAHSAQRNLADEEWPGSTEIRVRMGIHVGEAQESDGDYFGPAVNRSARITSAAHGGQVLLSDVAKSLTGVEVADLGEHRLRDLESPERLWQAGPGAFPPLRSLQSLAGNLPVLPSGFIGRENDLAELAALLDSQRLVTLVGVGGLGKTRLAIECARRSTGEFSGGIWFCDLTQVSEDVDVVHAVAATLEVRPQPGLDSLASVLEFVRDRRTLLVLDNCEHVIDGSAALVSSLMASTPTATVLATSREPLAVDGEQVLLVPAIDAGVELFVSRATAADAGFSADNQVTEIDELVRHLDGIPLSIELAAARVRTMTVEDIIQRLHDRFRLLRGHGRDRPERQQSLAATLEWSYNLLDEAERQVFDRLSVFAGLFDTAAAKQVCGGHGAEEAHVVDALDALVDKSMVTVDRSGRSAWYRLLDTFKDFGADNMERSGVVERYKAAHLDYFAELSSVLGPKFFTPELTEAAEETDSNWANLRAAMATAQALDRPKDALRILRLASYYSWTVRSDETAGWAEQLTSHRDLGGLPAAIAALLASERGAPEALSWCDRAVEAGLDDPLAGLYEGLTRSLVHMASGRVLDADEALATALAAAEQLGAWAETLILHVYTFRWLHYDLDKAAFWANRTHLVAQQATDPRSKTWDLGANAAVAAAQGRRPEALALFEQTAEVATQVPAPATAVVLFQRARFARSLGTEFVEEHQTAIEHLDQARDYNRLKILINDLAVYLAKNDRSADAAPLLGHLSAAEFTHEPQAQATTQVLEIMARDDSLVRALDDGAGMSRTQIIEHVLSLRP